MVINIRILYRHQGGEVGTSFGYWYGIWRPQGYLYFTVSVWEEFYFVLFCFWLLVFAFAGFYLGEGGLAPTDWQMVHLFWYLILCSRPGISYVGRVLGRWPTHVKCPKHGDGYHCFLHGECGTCWEWKGHWPATLGCTPLSIYSADALPHPCSITGPLLNYSVAPAAATVQREQT